ncbi:MAG: P-II family nitrogen regulator [Gemmatimonadota bacterium]
MSSLVEIRAIVRDEMLDRIVHRLKECGVPRFNVTRVHAIGAGVDPATTKFSFREASAYQDKAQVQFICDAERCDMYTEIIAKAAHTGRKGDGIVSVHPVMAVTKIHSGATGLEALE